MRYASRKPPIGSNDSSAKAGRVDVAVATVADRVRAVPVELLADRRGAPRVRFQALHAGRRRGRGLTEQVREDEVAARHGRRRRAIGGDLVNARLGQQAAAGTVLGDGHLAHVLAGDPLDAVVLGEATIEEGEVRIDQVADAQVLRDEFGQEELRLTGHRLAEPAVVLGIERLVGRRRVHLVEPERLTGEVLDEPFALRIVEHPVDLACQYRSPSESRPAAARSRSSRSGIERQRK